METHPYPPSAPTLVQFEGSQVAANHLMVGTRRLSPGALPRVAAAAVTPRHIGLNSLRATIPPSVPLRLRAAVRKAVDIRVRVQLIGHTRNNMSVNLSHAWL